MSWLRGILLAPVIAALTLWAGAALWLDGPASRIAAGALVAGFAVAAAGTLLRVRPPRRGLVGFGILFLGILGWWLSLVPSNDRDWDPAVSRLPTAVIDPSGAVQLSRVVQRRNPSSRRFRGDLRPAFRRP